MEAENLTCEICEKSFSRKQGYKNHIQFVHGNAEKQHKCKDCNFEGMSLKGLEEHVSAVHRNEKSYKCHICPKMYARQQTLKDHIKDNHEPHFKGHTCDKCEFVGKSKSSIIYHVQMSHSNLKKFVCQTCDMSYPNRVSLLCHINSVHKGVRHTCDICNTSFSQKSSMLKHKRDHHGEESKLNKQCDLCGKILAREEQMKVHRKKVHFNTQLIQCDQCDYKCKERNSLKDHISTVHIRKRAFKCERCPERFFSYGAMKQHEYTKHKNTEKRFKCIECDYKSVSKQTLQNHLNGVHLGLRPFKCKACGQGFTQQSHMNSHYKRVHLALKPHICEFCERGFASKQQMKLHITANHDDSTGAKKLKCVVCEFTTNSNKSLKNHAYQHGEYKPFPCEECDKAFVTITELKTHIINAHTDEVAYPCSHCTVQFMSRNSLKRHIIFEHPDKTNCEIKIKWHECGTCEFKSKRKDGLRKHMKNIHAAKEVSLKFKMI